MIFGGKIVSYLVYLCQGEDFKLTTELSEKVQYPHKPGNRKRIKWSNTAYWIKEAYVQDKILCISSNKDLIL